MGARTVLAVIYVKPDAATAELKERLERNY
jgi:hypothetical protein